MEGKLRKAWNLFLCAILLFGVHEVVGSLAEFNVFEIEGLYAITELFFIAVFLITVFSFKKLFDEISLGKKK